MKYNPEKTAERLHGVPLENRAFIYDATIIIEFLNQTFMPVSYFLSPKGYKDIAGVNPFEKENFKESDTLEKHRESVGTVYDWYKLFREQRDYTAPIESRYKFQVILKKLNFSKNGWCFDVKRVGRAQIIYFAPMMLRARAPKEHKEMFPPMKSKLEETPVEVSAADHDDDNIEVVDDGEIPKSAASASAMAVEIHEKIVKKPDLRMEKLADGTIALTRGNGIPVDLAAEQSVQAFQAGYSLAHEEEPVKDIVVNPDDLKNLKWTVTVDVTLPEDYDGDESRWTTVQYEMTEKDEAWEEFHDAGFRVDGGGRVTNINEPSVDDEGEGY